MRPSRKKILRERREQVDVKEPTVEETRERSEGAEWFVGGTGGDKDGAYLPRWTDDGQPNTDTRH